MIAMDASFGSGARRHRSDTGAMTRRALFAALASAPFVPACIARWKLARHRREWEKLFAGGEACARALGLMSEQDVEAYVERVIHEYRQEQREKEQAAAITA